MLGLDQILSGIVLPGAVGAVILIILPAALRRLSIATRMGITWPLALGAAYGAAHAALDPSFRLDAHQATDWLVFAAVAAAVAGCLTALPHQSGFASWIVRALICAAVPPAMLWVKLPPGWRGEDAVPETDLLADFFNDVAAETTWSAGTALAWWASTAVTILALWVLLSLSRRDRTDPILPALLTLVAGVTGMVLALSGSLILGRFAIALASALGTGAVVSWCLPDRRVSREAAGVALTILCGLLLVGYHYSDLSAPCALLLAAALFGGIPWPPAASRRAAWFASACRLLIAVVPLVTALLIAILAFDDS